VRLRFCGQPRRQVHLAGRFIGRVATNTTLAACAAGLTSIIYGYIMTKKWDASYTTNGFLAGLVAITCPCYWVSPTGAVLLGGIAGVLVILGVDLLEWLRIDDPIGAVPVHGFCGIWGTLSLGLFACGKYGATGPISPDNSAPLAGLFYGGGLQVLKAQLIGSACITLATFGVAMVVMLVVNAIGMLRGWAAQSLRVLSSFVLTSKFRIYAGGGESGLAASCRADPTFVNWRCAIEVSWLPGWLWREPRGVPVSCRQVRL